MQPAAALQPAQQPAMALQPPTGPAPDPGDPKMQDMVAVWAVPMQPVAYTFSPEGGVAGWAWAPAWGPSAGAQGGGVQFQALPLVQGGPAAGSPAADPSMLQLVLPAPTPIQLAPAPVVTGPGLPLAPAGAAAEGAPRPARRRAPAQRVPAQRAPPATAPAAVPRRQGSGQTQGLAAGSKRQVRAMLCCAGGVACCGVGWGGWGLGTAGGKAPGMGSFAMGII